MSESCEYPGSWLISYPDSDSDPITEFDLCSKCNFCRNHWKQTSRFNSLITGCNFKVPVKGHATRLTCNSKNVIYLITCNKCEAQYVGLTSQKIKERIGQHIRHIKKNDLSTYLVRHFNNNDHDISDIRVNIIDYITDNKESSHELMDLENYWIRTLNSVYPFGLNDNVKGVGNISRSDISSFNANNTPYFSIPQCRKKRSHGRRGISNDRNTYEVVNVLKQLLEVSKKHIHLLYVSFRGLSHKVLFKIRELVLNNIKDYDKKFCHMVLAFTSKLIIPKTSKIKDRMVFVVPYLNKIMDKINLSGILNCKKVKQLLPANLKFPETPMISYKFGKTIGQSLFNYNKILREISVSDSEHLTCYCDNEGFAPYVYKNHGHVHTGNLDIIENIELRNIMMKGARFREIPFVHRKKYFSILCSHLEGFVQKWARKEGTCPSNFDKWFKLVKSYIFSKIQKIDFAPIKEVLHDENVKQYISGLHEKFVICPIDKAGHNFAIVCKKFYIDILRKELGVDTTASGNDVYKPVLDSLDNLVSNHADVLKEDFNITLKESDRNIPLMYWISKQHKNPYKFRFISGASHCTTKPLSVELSFILKLIKQHFKNYCQKIHKNTGLQMYWSVDNSLDCLKKFNRVEASSIHTYDFSTLYTNLPLHDVLERLTELICRMFKNANSLYISVNSFTKKAFWSNERKKGSKSYTMHQVLDALEFILFNTYVRFGEYIFLQTRGIPMGGNASPLIADLYLSWLEFCFLDKLVKKKETGLVHQLSHNCRYIDDIATPNFNNFLELASKIYPKEIPLEANNGNGSRDTFLDLDIRICDGNFIFKVFHKVDLFNFEVISFPFLESNVPKRICYSTFFSQLIRFMRICSNIFGFAERVKLLWTKLIHRNYEASILKRYFTKFLCQYSDEVIKYGHDIHGLLQFCLDLDTSLIPSFSNYSGPAGTDVTTHVNHNDSTAIQEAPSICFTRKPIPLVNLRNTCYLNCILQVLFQLNSVYPFHEWFKHLVQIDKSLHAENIQVLLFYKFFYLCNLHEISHGTMVDFVETLNMCDAFFCPNIQRDVHEGLLKLIAAFNYVCQLPILGNEISDMPEFMDIYFGGIYQKSFTCTNCAEVNIWFQDFHGYNVQPSESTNFMLSNQTEQSNLTCDKCHTQILQNITTKLYEPPRVLILQVNRFSISSSHQRNIKNTQPLVIYQKVRFGLVDYILFGVIEHLGVSVDSGHYTCYVSHDLDWYMCNDITVRKAVLPSDSKNAYLLFYKRCNKPDS